MPTEVIMPKVDMDMSHGTLAVWHVTEGAPVRQGDPLFDIETEKAAMEVEAPASGQLHHVRAKAGERVQVGTPIAWIYAEGEVVGPMPGAATEPEPAAEPVSAPAQSAPTPQASVELHPEPAPTVQIQRSTPVEVTTHHRATPLARRLARSSGISIAEISGTGPRGRVQHDDVAEEKLRREHVSARTPPATWSAEAGPLRITERPGKGFRIFLIHGFASDSASWQPLEKSLGPDPYLQRLDLPNHGRSPKRVIDSFAAAAKMIVEAFDGAVAPGGSTHLVAHSLGAAFALALADIRPRAIKSLTLIAPAGLGPQINGEALEGIGRANHPDSLLPWLQMLTSEPGAIGPEYARAAFAARSNGALRAAQADMANVLFRDGVQTFDLRPALARLEIPTQIIWGKGDQIIPFGQSLSLRGHVGLHLLNGAGHIPQYEVPEKVARIIRLFVAGVDATTP
jgi:pimeloyl-ACP methyl ester carboxylesterase